MAAERGTIRCPACGHCAHEPIPLTYCLYFYECLRCAALLRPTPGDCCVFCSFGDQRCPSALPEPGDDVVVWTGPAFDSSA